MKIARKAPTAVKSPVYVTDSKYELHYMKPVLLGTIEKVDGYWRTGDGMRFVSSRNALDYLAKIREMIEVEVQLEHKYRERLEALRKSSISAAAPAAPPAPRPTSVLLRKPNSVQTTARFPHGSELAKLDELIRSLGYVKPQ